jgi:hypothetical protein
MFTLDVDRLPRLDHAKDLERQADALDGQAASAAKAASSTSGRPSSNRRKAKRRPVTGIRRRDASRPDGRPARAICPDAVRYFAVRAARRRWARLGGLAAENFSAASWAAATAST